MAEQKTEHVKRMIVRYIREQQLKRGERLPSQDFFRQKFSCGTTTVRAAIEELKNDGVLEVRDKVGVYVIDPNADGHTASVIGICAIYSDSPYYCCLLCAIQSHLNRLGCMAHLFFKYRPDDRTSPDLYYDISDYPGLARSVESKILDGIIHLDDFNDRALRFFAKAGIPTLSAGGLPLSENSVSYDLGDILRRMCVRLKKMNVTCPALVSVKTTEAHIDPLFLKYTGGQGIILSNEVFTDDGSRFIERFMALPEDRRPDLILYMDDILAQAITSKLVFLLPREKLPKAMIFRSRQLQTIFAVENPVFFNMDLDHFAALIVNTLMKNVKIGNIHIGRICYRPEEQPEFSLKQKTDGLSVPEKINGGKIKECEIMM